MRKIWIMTLSLALLTACTEEVTPTPSDTGTTPPTITAAAPTNVEESIPEETTLPLSSGYFCDLSGVKVSLAQNFASILESLGEPQDYFEAASCAFDGLDKIYYYNGFELRTCPQDDEDFVSAILLKDDSVATPEGVYIGMSLAESLEKVGEDYTQEGEHYSYRSEDGILTLVSEDDLVKSIIYVLDGTQENV